MRTDARSVAASAGASRSRRNIVATPGKTVTRWRSDRLDTRSGAKRSTSATVAPTSSGASKAPLRPNECASGKVARTTSCGVSAITGPAHDSIASSSAVCESTAPFGRPGAAGSIENQRRGVGLGPGAGTLGRLRHPEPNAALRAADGLGAPRRGSRRPGPEPDGLDVRFGDDQGGSEIREDVGAFLILQKRVEGSHGGAELPARDERDRESPVVSDRERDAIAGLHAAGRECLRERAHPQIQLAECQGTAVPDERGLLGSAARAGFEAPGEVLRHGRVQAKKSLRSIRCQTSDGTRCRGVYEASDGLAVASTPHFAVSRRRRAPRGRDRTRARW